MAAALTRCVTALFSPLRNTADTCRPTAGCRAFSTSLGSEALAIINTQTLTRLTDENVYVPVPPPLPHRQRTGRKKKSYVTDKI